MIEAPLVLTLLTQIRKAMLWITPAIQAVTALTLLAVYHYRSPPKQ